MGLSAVVVLSGCQQWDCAFESHGACIEFANPPADLEDAQARVDRLLEVELAFWGLSNLDDWRIQFRTSAEYPCYFATRNEGCTDYILQTISVKVPEEAPECFEASELLHELGHYELGDPMHSSDRWLGVDEQFAPIVWDRPDATPSCVERFEGIRAGMWRVRVDEF